MTPHAAAVLDLMRQRRADGKKPFMHGPPTAMPTAGMGHTQEYLELQAALVELVAAGLVVETVVIDRVSEYELREAK